MKKRKSEKIIAQKKLENLTYTLYLNKTVYVEATLEELLKLTKADRVGLPYSENNQYDKNEWQICSLLIQDGTDNFRPISDYIYDSNTDQIVDIEIRPKSNRYRLNIGKAKRQGRNYILSAHSDIDIPKVKFELSFYRFLQVVIYDLWIYCNPYLRKSRNFAEKVALSTAVALIVGTIVRSLKKICR